MVSINNSNNTRSFGSSGILGLSSGIDSESVIEGMLSGTQSKIDKQLGLKQQTLWKQEIYRGIIGDIQSLQRKYFDTLNPQSNLLSNSFFSNQTVTSSSLSVQATSYQRTASEFTIDSITQLATGSKIISQTNVSNAIQCNVNSTLITGTSSINISLDGVNKTISLYGLDNTEVLNNLQNDLNKVFGIGVNVAVDGTITTSGSRQINISGSIENLACLGFTSSISNRVDVNTPLSNLNLKQDLIGTNFKFSINGINFEFDETQSLANVVETINKSDANVTLSYSNVSDIFTLTSKTLGQGVQIDCVESEGNLLNALLKVDQATYQTIDGKNAILSVNGTTIERNTNNFEVNQFKLNLISETNTKTVLSSKNNTTQIVDGLTKFVEEYNKLIDKVFTLTTEKSEYREFSPLTDEQKKDMSETEVELWEKKAKTGLVRSDTNLVALLSELRQVLFMRPTGSSLSLNDMGIASSSFGDRGKLTIDTSKLNTALETRMNEVQSLFTDKENGIAVKFNAILNKNTQSSLSSPGRLVTVAGIANSTSDVKNTLTERIKSIELTIDNFKRMYESQKTRYWKQFSQLETAMSKMNSQSSWLTQQLG